MNTSTMTSSTEGSSMWNCTWMNAGANSNSNVRMHRNTFS